MQLRHWTRQLQTLKVPDLDSSGLQAFEVSERSRDRLKSMYAVSCQHGERRLDRVARVQSFLGAHAGCNPAWAPLARQPRESEAGHAARLSPLFPFARNANMPVVPLQTALPGALPPQHLARCCAYAPLMWDTCHR